MSSWTAYINNISWQYAENVRTVWHQLMCACPNIKPPRAGLSPDESSFLLVWDNDTHYLDVEIYPDATFEWFYRNRDTDQYHGNEEPVACVDGEMLEYLTSYAT